MTTIKELDAFERTLAAYVEVGAIFATLLPEERRRVLQAITIQLNAHERGDASDRDAMIEIAAKLAGGSLS
jgi:hypothetical protein